MRFLHIQLIRLQERCSSMLLNERSNLPICSLDFPVEATVRVKILSVPPMDLPVTALQRPLCGAPALTPALTPD